VSSREGDDTLSPRRATASTAFIATSDSRSRSKAWPPSRRRRSSARSGPRGQRRRRSAEL